MSVSEFIYQINAIIGGEFTIEGEVSQFKVSQGKWIFFDIKDELATLSCFSTVFMLRTPLEDGMKVRVTGYPKIHDKSGRFSFTVQNVELVGEGSLKRAYELLKKKLEAEGLFDAGRKRSIPRIPERIGVIASLDSAAFGDFKRIVSNRWGGVELVVRHVAVQGEMAVNDIVIAFREFNESKELCDVLVLTRGGGSLEDLMAFNSEEVARAVYGSRIPVVCAVGHERDESLADFVADVRASTPSNAAELVVPDRKDFVQELEFELDTAAQTLVHRLHMLEQGIETHFYRMVRFLETPLAKVQVLLTAFGGLQAKLERVLATRVDFIRCAELVLQNTNPKRLLQRGYSITRDAKGKVVRSADHVDTGDALVIELGTGTIDVTAK